MVIYGKPMGNMVIYGKSPLGPGDLLAKLGALQREADRATVPQGTASRVLTDMATGKPHFDHGGSCPSIWVTCGK